jgi:pimeloyl-ACP methyl ester carboxylesterase
MFTAFESSLAVGTGAQGTRPNGQSETAHRRRGLAGSPHFGNSLAGGRIPSQGLTADGAPTLLGFGSNAWNAEATALSLHALFPHRSVVAFLYRGHAPSRSPSAGALFSDSLMIFDHLVRTRVGERIIPVGFSMGAAVAPYLGRHRSVAG